MRLSSSFRVADDESEHLDAVRRQVQKCFPTLAIGLEIILGAADNGPTLRARNTIDRLAFGHLRPAYLQESAVPVLAELKPVWAKNDELLQLLDAIRASDRAGWTADSLRAIASAAVKLKAAAALFFKASGRDLLVEICRHGFGLASPTNSNRIDRAAKAFLLFGSFSNSTRAVAASLRKELSTLDLVQEPDALKVSIRAALESLWRTISVETRWTVVLEAGDVAVRAGAFEILGLKFYNPAVVELVQLGMTVEPADPPEFLERESARVVTQVCAAIGDSDRAFALARERVDLVLACAATILSERFVPHRGRAARAFFGPDSYQVSQGTPQPPSPRWWADRREIDILKRRFTDYIGPLLEGDIGDEDIRESFKRSLLSFTDALSAKAFGLGSLAVSAMWTALEVLLLEHEQGDRGPILARRLSSFAVSEDSVRVDDVVRLEAENVAEFVAEYRAGKLKLYPHVDRILRDHSADQQFMFMLLQMDCAPVLLAWKGEQHRKRLAELSAPERESLVAARVREMIAQVSDWYRLRNDVVHAGYSASGFVDVVFQELVDLYRSFILNYAFNVTKHGTREKLIRRMDEVFRERLGRVSSAAVEEGGSSLRGSETSTQVVSSNEGPERPAASPPLAPGRIGGNDGSRRS